MARSNARQLPTKYYTYTVRGVTTDSRTVRRKPFASLDEFRAHTKENNPGMLQGVVFAEHDIVYEAKEEQEVATA